MTADCIVLDTNVVLDWLVFDDPRVRGVGALVVIGGLRWIGTAAMRDEYFDVLGRPIRSGRAPDIDRHHAVWSAYCTLLPAPATGTGRSRVRCADADDQMFVDLVVSERPAWLLSRDKALLSLATRLGAHGTRVTTPADWSAGRPTGAVAVR